MRTLAIVAILFLATNASAAPELPPDIAATWAFDDDGGSLTLQLNKNGSCHITAFDKLAVSGKTVKCTYWVHGSRVNLRVKGQRDGEGFNTLQIERDPESDTLIVHGSKVQVLKRQAIFSFLFGPQVPSVA